MLLVGLSGLCTRQNEAAFSAALDRVHRGIGRMKQRLARRPINRKAGDADTGADADPRPVGKADRLADQTKKTGRDQFEQARLPMNIGDDDRDLVTAHTRHLIDRSPQTRIYSLSDRLEHDIARRVAVSVVDGLEAVQIK